MTISHQKFPKRNPVKMSRLARYFRVPTPPSLIRLQSDHGSALVMAAIFMVVATMLMVVGAQLISTTNRESRKRTVNIAEAESVAQAGLQDALGWFQRNSTGGGTLEAYDANYKPGAAPNFSSGISYVDQIFDPLSNTGNGQKNDTLVESIGIVNEYPMDSSVTAEATLWGRYEVWKVQNPAGAAAGTDSEPDAVHDVSGDRLDNQVNGDGTVWYITSIGYVYRRLDKTTDADGNFTVAYNQAPNVVVGKAKVSTELRKLGITLPSPDPSSNVSGLYCENSTNVTLQGQCLLNGAATAISNSVIALNTQ